ncbi:MAG: MarR family transcriptional regulator [Sphingomonadales bacterium]|nr:MarR family transcriptional regulator [Sphingomonadales bacterium]MBD3772391.1 MarR family transcriptional regulator [Paracoccaceae bacterium]
MHDRLLAQPGYVLRRAANAMSAELSRRLGVLGLRATDASVLILLEESPGITASAIGRAIDIQRANMVPLLRRLEDAGLIDKTPIDGKSQGLALTRSGRDTLAQAWTIIESFERELLERIPAEHRDHLLPALTALWQGEDD